MRNWRKYFTWFILLVNLLFLVLAIAVGASTSETVNEACQGLTDEELELCTDVYGYVLGGTVRLSPFSSYGLQLILFWVFCGW